MPKTPASRGTARASSVATAVDDDASASGCASSRSPEIVGAANAIEVNAAAASNRWIRASSVTGRPGRTVMKPAIATRETAKTHSQTRPLRETSPAWCSASARQPAPAPSSTTIAR